MNNNNTIISLDKALEVYDISEVETVLDAGVYALVSCIAECGKVFRAIIDCNGMFLSLTDQS